MNTYFNYQAPLKSLDLSRAISIPKGVGPFTGFGSAKFEPVSNNTQDTGSYNIVLYPEYYSENDAPSIEGLLPNYSFLRPLIKDIQQHHKLITSESVSMSLDATKTQEIEGNNVTFGLITRDGFICINSLDKWVVPISKYTGSSAPLEVAVFAKHNYVAEAVDNPVTLEAYAITYGVVTQSTDAGRDSSYTDINSFYDLYRRSLDIYYNQNNIDPDFSQHNPLSSVNKLNLRLSYNDLIGYVKSKVTSIDYDNDNLTLIGIYGKGTYVDENNQSHQEYFSIVPYEGKWPMEMPFNTAVMNGITKSMNTTNKKLEGFPFSVPNSSDEKLQNMNILEYIDYKIQEVKSSMADPVPSGLICLWDQATPPNGWHEYTAASGRVVIGFKSGGVKAGPNGTSVLTDLGQTYLDYNQSSDWQIKLTAENLPKHLHAFALATTSWTGESNTFDNPVPADWSRYDASLVNGGPSTGNNNVVRSWENMGMKNGAIKTGPNLTTTDGGAAVSTTNQQNSDSANIQKILPSITLMYIQKD